jgi:hypothetical protein
MNTGEEDFLETFKKMAEERKDFWDEFFRRHPEHDRPGEYVWYTRYDKAKNPEDED